MNIYLVARWGNNNDGVDGATDTMFLVAARTHRLAANIVDKVLRDLPHEKVLPYTNWVCLLGKVDEESKIAGVLKGPFYDYSALSGARLAWAREDIEQHWHKI